MVYIKIFVDYLDAIEPLGDAERGRLFTALLQYARTGEAPQLGGNERFLFPMIRAQLDRDNAEFEDFRHKQAENGKKGGRPKNPKNPPLSEKPTAFFETQKSQDKDKDKDKDKDVIPPYNPPLAGGMGFGPALTSAFEDWLRYKREKKQTYKPTGLQALQSEVRNKAAVYGEDAVAALIRQCMASNWKGIIWDILDRPDSKAGGKAADDGKGGFPF